MTASIGTQLASVYIPVLALASNGSYAAVARSPPLSQLSHLASIPNSRTLAFSEALYYPIDTSKAVENGQEEVHVGLVQAAIKKEV